MAKLWGKWKNTGSLGEGGQAHTFLVQTEDNPESFVLKQLKNPNRLSRFRTEVETGLALSHRNLVRVVDHDLETTERPWFVMEYCERGVLQYDEAECLSTVIGRFGLICDAVACAHAQGIVHRDLKPDNIFVRSDGSPAVGDFGLCFLTDDGERFTFSHEAVGPRWYMAPELEDGRASDVTPRADVYSLGKLLYWMITGRTFAREKHRENEFDLTRKEQLSEPFLIYELLDRMIVQDPAARFSDASEVGRALKLLKNRIELRAHAIGRDIPQPCNFCGIGLYKSVLHGNVPTAVSNFGFRQVSGAQWIIIACDHCGNVQIFRPDKSRNSEIWQE